MNNLISILIPLFNVESYIDKCLHSIIENTIYSKCEIIMIDDCSTDNTYNTVMSLINDKYASYSSNITILKNEKNCGVAFTRNKLLNMATGEYVAFIDSDDWIQKDYLEKLYNEAKSTNADVVGCWRFDEYSNKIIKQNDLFCCFPKENLKYLLKGGLFSTLHCRLIKTSLITENNISFVNNKNMGEDFLFMIKVFFFSKHNSLVKENLYHYYRSNNNSLCSSSNIKNWDDRNFNIREAELFLTNNKYSELEMMNYTKARVMLLAMISNDKYIRHTYSNCFPEALNYIYKVDSSNMLRLYVYFYSRKLFFLCWLMRQIKKAM